MERIVTRVRFDKPNIPKPKRVAAYARVSSGKDAMLHSLSAQVSYYSGIIQSHNGWKYAGVYADEALTGTKIIVITFKDLSMIAVKERLIW
jgi:hypothetical protein